MASKLDLMIEAERRGILPQDKAVLLTEARRRGLIGDSNAQPQVPYADEPGAVAEGDAKSPTAPRPVTEVASQAYRDVAGTRTGIDPENYDTVRRYAGFLTPVADIAAAGAEVVGGGLNALLMGGAQGLENMGVIDAGSGRRLGRDLVNLKDVSGLVAGMSPANPAAPVARSAAPQAVTKPSRLQDLVTSFDRANVTPSVAATTDSRAVRGLSTGLENTPLIGRPVAKTLDRNVEEVANQADVLARRSGTPTDAVAMGETLQRGANTYVKRSRDVGADLYKRAQDLTGDVRVAPEGAIQAIDRNLADLSKLPNQNRATIKAFEDIRADLVDESGRAIPVDIQTLRDMRTSIRTKLIADGLRATDAERRANQVFDAAKKDIEGALGNNPQALNAYRRADKFWSDRVERIDGSLTQILGKTDDLDPEKATARILQMAGARGSSSKLAGIMKSIPKQDRGDISATIISNLGRKDEAFSPAIFATQWQKLSPRAKNIMFDAELRSELDNLAKVARRVGDVDKARPRGSANTQAAIGSMLGVATWLEPTTLVATGSGYTSALALSSPRYVRWLAHRSAIEQKARRGLDVRPDLQKSMRDLELLAAANDNASPDIARLLETFRANSGAVAQVEQEEQESRQ